MEAVGVVPWELPCHTSPFTSAHRACMMMTTTMASAADTILAINLGKHKIVAPRYGQCILTTTANRLIAPLHDRMPVILTARLRPQA
jgi:putative SOS response-associated peptidase YedK